MSSESFIPVEPIYGPTNPDEKKKKADPVKRFAAVIELDPEKEQEYRKLHADVWPEVRAAIKKAGFRNFSIFTVELDGRKYLFNYQEYTGDDLDADIASLVENPIVRDEWLPLTDACQIRLPGTRDGEHWKSIEMLMHLE